eukprot:600797-Prymnesium_polylepis.1
MMFMRVHGRSAKPTKSSKATSVGAKTRPLLSSAMSSTASRGAHALAAAARAAHNERRASSAAAGVSAASA